MRRRRLLPGSLLVLTVAASVSCHDEFDATRQPPIVKTTLGEDLYGTLCDRLGASSLAEDLAGASYHAICHKDAAGHFGDTVDASLLPPGGGEARRLGVAKLEALAKRRGEVVAALDATFPDVKIPDPKNESKQVRLHDALVSFTKALTPLYESTPFGPDANGNRPPLVPATTQAVGRLFDAVAGSDKAQASLSRLSGRLGYRPLRVGLGAIRPTLAYPGLRRMTQTALKLIMPGGPAEKELRAALDVAENELRTAVPETPTTPYIVVDKAKAQPNRPRTDLELIQTMLVSENPAFKRNPSDPPRFVVARDLRGYALAKGSVPGVGGTVTAPFADKNGDGLADVDAFGRFVDAKGAVLPIDLPFDYPPIARVRAGDQFTRALDTGGGLLYQYIDSSQTLSGAISRDLPALVDPDPATNHETLMDTLGGAIVLYGDKAQRKVTKPYALSYDGFDPSKSPLLDLFYGLGQILGDRESDDVLQWLIDLSENHEDLLARTLGDALDMYANATDKSKPLNDAAALARTSTIWDEMAEILGKIAQVGPSQGNPNPLLEDVLTAVADDDILVMGKAFSKYTQFKERFSYDPDNLNGAAINTESKDHSPPHVPVNWTVPPSDGPGNQSALYQIFKLMHETNGVKSCNKEGAVANIELFGMKLKWPLIGGAKECGLFSFDNLGLLYVQAMVGKAKINLTDGFLGGLLGFAPMLGISPDEMFEKSIGINGMTLTVSPTPQALSRFVYFGADTSFGDKATDLDPYRGSGQKNEAVNKAISSLVDAMPTLLCPKTGPNKINKCSSFDQTLRARDPGTLFLFEHFDGLKALRPLTLPFVNHHREDLFFELVEVLYRHWLSPANGGSCSKSVPPSDPRYCTEDGVVAYEPILSDAFVGDMLEALHDTMKVIMSQRIQSSRVTGGVRSGVDVLASVVRTLVDPSKAAAAGMTDRFGKTETLWSDGVTVKPQITPFDLFANGLVGMDDRFASAKDFPDRDKRKAMWKHARSQLVDQFLQIDGKAKESVFHNAAIPKALPITLRAVREHVNAHCPDRESGTPCTWATKSLTNQLAESMGGPTFAALINLGEKLRGDEEARREVEKFLTYLLSEQSGADAFESTLASLSDIFQILRDDPSMAPIMAAGANAAAPDDALEGNVPAPGLVITLIKSLQAFTDPNDTYDPYRVVDVMLKNLVAPMDPKKPSLTPLEVFVDTVAEINRIDASVREQTLAPADYRAVAETMRDFMVSKTRGMEQFYEIVRHRDGD